jgi:hypothetical protein
MRLVAALVAVEVRSVAVFLLKALLAGPGLDKCAVDGEVFIR